MRFARPGLVALAALLGVGLLACDEAAVAPGTDETFPAASVRDCDGAPVDLGALLADKDVTYVTFGAKWCTACQHEAPLINAQVVDGFAGRSVGAVQILVEDDPGEAPPQALCAAWRDQLDARFTVLVDVDQETVDPLFGGAVATLPLHLVVTRDGVIRHRTLGELPPNLSSLIQDWL